MGLFSSIKEALEPKPKNKCPECGNNSLVPWVIRLHTGSELTENPTIYPVGIRCEECIFSVVHTPMIVFELTLNAVGQDGFPSDSEYDLLVKSIERCVIDHRKDCIPKFAWDVVAPRIKKTLARNRARECTSSPLNTMEYWESDSWTVICYEAFGMCVWGLD